MKLVYIANFINGTTGLERMILYQANYFIKYFNYKVDIILLDQKSSSQSTNFEIDDNINLYYLDSYKKGFLIYFDKVKGINKFLNKLQPTVVMVCIDEVFGLYLGRFIKKRFPLIYQRHTTGSLNLNFQSRSVKTRFINSSKKQLIKKSGYGYDRFIVLTEENKQDWKHLSNIEVISNPVTLTTNNEMSTLESNTVIAVGRQDYIKGYDMLLECWKIVHEKYPNWRLHVYGRISKKLNLKDISSELGLGSSVNFFDHTNDIKSAYLDSSILVCSSRIEGFSLVIAEAMSLGIPAVSFDCPYGPRAIIKHGEDGLLVEPNNTEKLAEALMTLIEDKDLRKQMGERAQVNIQRYAPDKIMQQWKSLFESVLQE